MKDVLFDICPVWAYNLDHQSGRIAQQERAPLLQGGGHRFKSCFAHDHQPSGDPDGLVYWVQSTASDERRALCPSLL